jgi:hypothetical protein
VPKHLAPILFTLLMTGCGGNFDVAAAREDTLDADLQETTQPAVGDVADEVHRSDSGNAPDADAPEVDSGLDASDAGADSAPPPEAGADDTRAPDAALPPSVTVDLPTYTTAALPRFYCAGDEAITKAPFTNAISGVDVKAKIYFSATCAGYHKLDVLVSGVKIGFVMVPPGAAGTTVTVETSNRAISIPASAGSYTEVTLRLVDSVDRCGGTTPSCGTSDGSFLRQAIGGSVTFYEAK